MGLLLTIIALLLLFVMLIPSLIVGIVISLFNHSGNRYFKDIAISLDQLGNVLCQHLFNLVLIKNSKHKFGNPDSTVSSCLGKNYRDGTLTRLGMFISKVLNSLDDNHVIKSIDETE